MSIINVFLPEHRKAVDIEYMPTEHQGPMTGASKEFHYDFMCRDVSGTVFIVDLQRYYEDHWFRRCVSYASRAYDRQNRRGKDYEVPPVYLIGLMGVEIDHQDPELWKDRYVSEYTFREKNTNELLDETIVIIFAELSRFDKPMEACDTELYKILYVLKNIGRMMEQPSWLVNDIYTRIFRACEIAAFSLDKRIAYDSDMNDERRLAGERAAYRRLGLKQGREEGRAEGRAEGRVEAQSELLRNLMQSGMPVEEISRLVKIDVEDILKITSSDR